MACCKCYSVFFVRSVENDIEPSQTYDEVNKLFLLTWTNHFQHVSKKKILSYLWLLFQIKSYIYLHHRVLF